MEEDKLLLAKALAALKQARERADMLERNDPIAIIGLSCRFPGGAESPEQFWSLLQAGFDSSIEVPKERWDINQYYDPDPDAPGKIVSRKSSFLTSSIAEFDADFFGISPREAEYLDPQQRLLLEVTWEALEDSGIAPKTINQSLCGVFIGISSHDYEDLLTQAMHKDEINAYFGTGNAASTATGRISYTLGLQGPSMAVDTACSSSLVALHQACQSLRLGECDAAIAGGVNVILSPELSINFSQAHMLAADGHCKTFDKAADGYVRGEGCGIVILKRLSDALRNKDRILAVIKGSAVNQDGASGGLTVPNGPAQEAVIRRALAQAQLEPHEIDYIETHGTGTSLGDPIEVNALTQVFKGRNTVLTIGTVKTNMGHLEAAAGIAGIIKTVLALCYEEIPRHLHFKEINPAIHLEEIPAQIPIKPVEWKAQSGRVRRAGVSGFAFSGTNAHVILEEAPEQDPSQIREGLPKTVFNRQRYWPSILTRKKNIGEWGEEIHPLLGLKLPESANQESIIYEQKLDLTNDSCDYLHDHEIYGHVIYPASGYIEMLLGALKTQESSEVELSALSLERPLELSAQSTVMQVIVDKNKATVYSKTAAGWQLHSECEWVESKSLYEVAERLSELKSRITTEVDLTNFYAQVQAAGIAYGPYFQVMQKAFVSENEALVYLETKPFDARYLAYPTLVDGGLQGLGLFGGQEGIYLPMGCGRIR
ncbi:MAG: type I polyketide synthase, partial [Gammaproteobacteria bacterium]